MKIWLAFYLRKLADRLDPPSWVSWGPLATHSTADEPVGVQWTWTVSNS